MRIKKLSVDISESLFNAGNIWFLILIKDVTLNGFSWYSRWESNPELPLRRGLLYPFNYGSGK